MRNRRHRALVSLIQLLTVRPKLCYLYRFGPLKHLWVIRCTRLMLYRENVRILLVNLLQSSRSTFSCEGFLSFFAFKEGMLDIQISALGG